MTIYERVWRDGEVKEVRKTGDIIDRIYFPPKDGFIRYKQNGKEKKTRIEYVREHHLLVDFFECMNIRELIEKYPHITIRQIFENYTERTREIEDTGLSHNNSKNDLDEEPGKVSEERKAEFEKLKRKLFKGKKIIEKSKKGKPDISMIGVVKKRGPEELKYIKDLYGNGEEN